MTSVHSQRLFHPVASLPVMLDSLAVVVPLADAAILSRITVLRTLPCGTTSVAHEINSPSQATQAAASTQGGIGR